MRRLTRQNLPRTFAQRNHARTFARRLARAAIPLATVALLGAATGCSTGETDDDAMPADTLTQQQRDSILGESNLPGAGGVGGALDASGDAADRAARHDSLADDL